MKVYSFSKICFNYSKKDLVSNLDLIKISEITKCQTRWQKRRRYEDISTVGMREVVYSGRVPLSYVVYCDISPLCTLSIDD